MKLGVYIGSFNPPHIGHLDVVNYLINNHYVDKVLIVPTLGYWDKNNLVDIKHRINMFKLLQNKNILVEEELNEIEYTYELMDELEKKYKAELYLILGADNIIKFHEWYNYEALLKYKIIIVNRNNINIQKYIKKYDKGNFIIIQNYPFTDISSTYIRKHLTDKYLDLNVLNYIKENNLYKKEE